MPAHSVRATRRERVRTLAGDELIPQPSGSLTHAVTIEGTPRDVWPWLAQMGAGSRAGWYSYDYLDNGRVPSARRVVAELQQISVGTVFPALPGATEGFELARFEPGRFLVLCWKAPDGACLVTWAFVLDNIGQNCTRLIVRARGGPGYRFHGLPQWGSLLLVRPIHFLMQRRQLLGIASRVEESEPLLDRFLPHYDVVERHRVRIDAPAEVTISAARDMDLMQSRLARAIFRGREIITGAQPVDQSARAPYLVEMLKSLGWGVLAEVPGREIVLGAVTKPWEADVVFRAIPAPQFAAFDEPGYVKIAFTLRADPVGANASIFRTETRALGTDALARRKFGRYWSWASYGIRLIRRSILAPLKADAERRAHATQFRKPAA